MADSQNGSGYGRPNNAYSPAGHAYHTQYVSRGQVPPGYTMPADLTVLAHGLNGMNIQPPFASQAKNGLMPTGSASYSPIPVAAPSHSQMMAAAVAPYLYHNGYGNATGNSSPNMYTPHAAQYMTPASYPGYQHHEQSPYSQNWTPPTVTTDEVPTLVTPRRDSVSSNENDLPPTPSYPGYAGGLIQGNIALNRSPSGMFSQSTPSPGSMIGTYGIPVTKQPEYVEVSPRIKHLLNEPPQVPRAIPAPSSPLKPLDRALENQRGETNVYIRGLLPETTDEMLEIWGSRFGDIVSSKSIIDLNTKLCKGFGFVKYHNYEDAENCIRGFHYLGYEVSFARESFYSKLKAFSDEQNTNLYVSNLPKTMNEHELAQLFHPHQVFSSKILRDKNGHARGVGFARFDSRETCEEVIKIFQNHTIKTNEEELQIQIRFSDTQEQKMLKQQTQAARQFRSAEYEYATKALRNGLTSADSNLGDRSGNEFERHLGTTPSVPIQSQRWAQAGLRQAQARSPLANSMTCASSAKPLLSRGENGVSVDAKDITDADDTLPEKQLTTSTSSVHINSPVESNDASEVL